MRLSRVIAFVALALISAPSGWAAPKGASSKRASSTPAAAGSPIYDSCCVCIPDIVDSEMFDSMCKRWFQSARKEYGCEYQRVMPKVLFKELPKFMGNDRCRKVHLYGAFHGDSSMTQVPFEYSVLAAKTFQATQVCYEGASCLVFDNVEDVKACARGLAGGKCRYEISGNQNAGVASQALFCRARELPDASSKLTAFIDGASVQLQYAPCTKQGSRCGYISKTDFGQSKTHALSKNDPNSKSCIHQGTVVVQSCCIKKRPGKADPDFGKWSAPGAACP